MKKIIVIVSMILAVAFAHSQTVNVVDIKLSGGISNASLIKNSENILGDENSSNIFGDENFGNVEVAIYGRREIITGGQRGIGVYYKGQSGYAKIGNVINGRKVNEVGIAYKFITPTNCSFVCGNFNFRGNFYLGGVRIFRITETPIYYRTETWNQVTQVCTIDSGYTKGLKQTISYGGRFSGNIGIVRSDPATLPGCQRWLYSVELGFDVWQLPKNQITFYNLAKQINAEDKSAIYYDGRLTVNLVYIPLNHSAKAGICPVVAIGARNITNYIFGDCLYAEYGLGIHGTKGTGEALSIRLFTVGNQSFRTSFGGMINLSLIDLYQALRN